MARFPKTEAESSLACSSAGGTGGVRPTALDAGRPIREIRTPSPDTHTEE